MLAAAPDLDLLFPGYHRSITHSVTAVAAVGLVAAALAAIRGRPVVRVASMCAAALATHLLLDWMAVDRDFAPFGVQLLWPFSDRWFISRWDIFPGTERHNIFSVDAILRNAQSAATEIVLIAPFAVVFWLVRVKALAGFPSQLARRHHSPQ
jgi:membrane-bound metal-dependent hydrolase YbcI (DUF457 family)